MNNLVNQKDSTSHLELNYCGRCKITEADFKCESCSPNIFFCSYCDEYIHSINSNRQHSRNLIEKRNLIYYREDHSKRNYEEFKESKLFNSNSNNFYISSPINPEFSINNNHFKNSNTLKENYSNDIFDRDNLLNTIYSLEKEIESTRSSMNEQIINLQNQLEENNRNHSLTIQNVIQEHEKELRKILNEKENEKELRKIINDKENEIKLLFNKCKEFERGNNELSIKLNEHQNEIFQIKSLYPNKLSAAEFDIKQKDNELAEIKNHFEKKFSILSENFNEEKSNIISNYQKNIEKIIIGYKETKERYLTLLNKRDHEFNDLLSRMRKEEIKYENVIVTLKSEISKYRQEISSLNETSNNLKIELKNCEENLEKSKMEIKFYLKQSQKFEEDHRNSIKDRELMKSNFLRLNTITNGKLTGK